MQLTIVADACVPSGDAEHRNALIRQFSGHLAPWRAVLRPGCHKIIDSFCVAKAELSIDRPGKPSRLRKELPGYWTEH